MNDALAQLPAGELSYVPTFDRGQIRVFDTGGPGPVVLLAHGYLLDLTVWSLVYAPLVAAGHRVIAFDQRGHAGTRDEGRCSSSAAAHDYRAVLEHFDIQDGTLVAHSMGGFLALLFCLQHPDAAKRLRRMVLLGANAGAVAQGSLQNKLQIPLLRSGLMPHLWKIPPIGRALLAALFGRDPNPDFIETTRNVLLRQDVRRSLPLLRAMCYENYYERVREIPLETIVLCGELDRTCPAWHSRELGARLPHATQRWLPNVGHMLMYEAPRAVVEAIGGEQVVLRGVDRSAGAVEQS